MRILYIHQYFSTPLGCTGTRSYEFAKRWVEAGHYVTILTTAAHLNRRYLEISKGHFFKKFNINGIDVFAISLSYRQQMGVIRRSIAFFTFVLFSTFFVLLAKSPDIIYATSTPLTVGIPSLVAKWVRKIPYIFEVRDQWPEIPIELDIIRNKLIIKILLWLEKRIYKSSAAVVALSPGMADGIRSVIGNKTPISVIPNGCDVNTFSADIDVSGIREKYGWGKNFILLHAGAMGKVNSLDFIIDAARKLGDYPEILFVLIGEGSKKSQLQDKVAELGLINIEILPAMPKQKLAPVFVAADIGLVIIGNYPIIQNNSANKFFDSLSAGKPVLLNYRGWKAQVIEKANAGFGCELYNVEEFVEKIKFLFLHRDKVIEMGHNACRIANNFFDRDKLAKQAIDVICSVVKSDI